MQLEQVLADAREHAAVLRSHGHGAQAKSIEGVCDAVADAMRPYLSVLSEKEAMMRSGWTVEPLRRRFAEWEAQGFAMLKNGKRHYRECIVPKRADRAAEREAGRRGERVG